MVNNDKMTNFTFDSFANATILTLPIFKPPMSPYDRGITRIFETEIRSEVPSISPAIGETQRGQINCLNPINIKNGNLYE